MSTYWMAGSAEEVIDRFVPYHSEGLMRNLNCPMGQTWIRNTVAYYSNVLEAESIDSSLIYTGEMGELIRMLVPQARSLVRQLVTLLTKQKLSFKALAEKQGTDVVQETRLANALMKQITKEQDVSEKRRDLAELTLVQGMSFYEAGWRSDRGELLSIHKGNPFYDGDLDIANRNVFNVLWNHNIRDWKDQWLVETRSRVNRWSLIAQYPNLKSALLDVPNATDYTGTFAGGAQDLFAEDEVWVYRIYHALTPALTKGRMIMYASRDAIMYDDVNPYGCIPVEPSIPERIDGYCLGYPILSNLLPCQEMLDHSFSAWATNQAATAVQNIAVPHGSNLTHEDIAGMNWFTYTPQNVPGGGKPEGINLSNTSPQTMTMIDSIMKHMGQLSNVTDALRGAPPPGVTSGRAIATLVANALEFISSADEAIAKTTEKVMMHGINCYRRFATRGKIVHIAGRNYESYSRRFVGKELDPIHSVEIQRINAMLQSYSGRLELLEMLQKDGRIKDMAHFVSVLEGNDPREAYQTELGEDDLIQTENERLMAGEVVTALSSDDHPAHIRTHLALCNDPNVRNDSKRVENILRHVLDEHYQLVRTTDPGFMAMARTGKMPQLGPPPGPEGPPPGPGPDAGEMASPAGPEGAPAEPAQDELGRVA